MNCTLYTLSELTETFERRVKVHTFFGQVAEHLYNLGQLKQEVSEVSSLPRFFRPLSCVIMTGDGTSMVQRARLLSQRVIDLDHNFAIDPSRSHPGEIIHNKSRGCSRCDDLIACVRSADGKRTRTRRTSCD